MANMDRRYIGLSDERFNLITGRYCSFLDACNDMKKEPVKVFDPLNKKSMEDLNLIREVSKDLQKKKEEDVKKAAQAAQDNAKESEEKKEQQE